MAGTSLLPIGVTAVALLTVTVAMYWAGDQEWANVLGAVGTIQVIGYIFVARMLYASGELAAIQLVFAAVATALLTKVVVFSPAVLARLVNPRRNRILGMHALGAGLVASWLIQASLGLLFLFPESVLRVAIAWAHPASLINIYTPPLVVGALLAQFTLARAIYTPSATAGSVGADSPQSSLPAPAEAAIPDGGESTVYVYLSDADLPDDDQRVPAEVLDADE